MCDPTTARIQDEEDPMELAIALESLRVWLERLWRAENSGIVSRDSQLVSRALSALSNFDRENTELKGRVRVLERRVKELTDTKASRVSPSATY